MSPELKFENAFNLYLKITDGTHDSPKQKETGKHLITSKHIKGRNIDFDSAYLISQNDFNKINERSAVHQWDVIVSMIGEYCGFCYIERNSSIDYAVKNVGIYKAGCELEAEWLYYYLISPIGKQYLNSVKSGSSQPYLTLGGLRSLPVLVPDSPTKKKEIVKILSDLDKKIELNNKINTELEAMAKLVYDYWFLQFDFPDSNCKPYKSSGGKMVYNEEVKREIPCGWASGKVGDILDTDLGGTPSTKVKKYWRGNIPWLNSGEIANFPIIEADEHITTDAIDNSAASLMPKGTCVLSITRHLRPSILAVDACANQSVVGIYENDKLKSPYLYPYLKNEIPRLMSLRTGAQQPHINKGIVDASKIILPPDEVLESYYKKVNAIYKQINNNAFQNKELTELRDWLLPMLMNGQVKVQ